MWGVSAFVGHSDKAVHNAARSLLKTLREVYPRRRIYTYLI